MKRIKLLPLLLTLCLLTALLIPCAMADVLDYTTKPESTSKYVVLADLDNQKILYSVNENDKAYPASTTKIMTALLAIEAVEREEISLEDMVTAKSGFRYGITDDASSAHIKEGETMSLRDLLYCAMLPSANEACNVIAMYVSGSIGDFVDLMNERAEQLGCTGTHFTNTNGMPDENHYTTAKDLYLISAEALKHEKFTEICDTSSYITAATNMSDERELYNSNALINPKSVYGSDYVYEGAYGVKTGHTDDAGHCLVAAAERGGTHILCVVLGAEGDYESEEYQSFEDTIKLFDWAFGNFSKRCLLEAGSEVGELPVSLSNGADKVALITADDITATAPMGLTSEHFVTKLVLDSESLVAPVLADTVLGKVELYDESGDYYGSAEVLAKDNVQMDVGEYLKTAAGAFVMQNWIIIAAILAGIIIIAFAIVILRHKARSRKAKPAKAKAPEKQTKKKTGKRVKK